MSTQQPEALRLADRLDLYARGDDHQQDTEEAAAELRRLFEEAEDLRQQNTYQDERLAWLEKTLTQAVEVMACVCEDACDSLHHAKKDRHNIGEPCPVYGRLRSAIANARQTLG